MAHAASVIVKWSLQDLLHGAEQLDEFAELLLDFADASAFNICDVATEYDADENWVQFEFNAEGTTAVSAFAQAHRLAIAAARHALRCHSEMKRLDPLRTVRLAAPSISFQETFEAIGDAPLAMES